MKRKISGIVLTALLLAAPGQASEQPLKVNAVHGIPYIAGNGQPDLVYHDARGRMYLSARDNASGIGPGRIRAAQKDGRERLWIVWETENWNRNQVFLGKRKHGQPLKSQRLSRGMAGSHHAVSRRQSPLGSRFFLPTS